MSVEVSTVALLRIAKHCFANESSVVSGCLLGLDNDSGEVEITNVFVHPAKGAADFQPQQADDSAATDNNFVSAAGSFQLESLRLLKSANIDANIVGWFQSSNYSSFVNEATVDIQFDYQSTNPNAVLIIADAEFANSGSPIKAFRLSPEYMAFHKIMRERKAQGPATLITSRPVSFKLAQHRVFVELDITSSISVLDEAYLFEHRTAIASTSSTKQNDPSPLLQQLIEVVEDLAIEKVRFSNLDKDKAPIVATATRIRGGEDETKRIQSGSDLVLLTENARRLCAHVTSTAEQTLGLCKLYEAARV
jgi:hypothetical protein